MSSNLNKTQWKSATDLKTVETASSSNTASPASPQQATTSKPSAQQLLTPTGATKQQQPTPHKPTSPRVFYKNFKENIKSIFGSEHANNNNKQQAPIVDSSRNNENRRSADSTSTLNSQTTPRTGSTSSQELIDIGETPSLPPPLPPASKTLGATAGSRLMNMLNYSKQTSDTSGKSGDSQGLSTHHNHNHDNNDPLRRNFGSLIDFNNETTASNYNNAANFNNNNNNNNIVNFNPKAAAINLKIIPSSMPSNYYIDKETLADLQEKLALLSSDERISLQQLSFRLLYDQYELHNSHMIALEEDIKELNSILVNKNETIRSQFEIDKLREEIRNLTNEKAELERMIGRKSGWNCPKCTFTNENESVNCSICHNERNVDEIYICSNCNTRNSIINVTCTKCSAYLGDITPTPTPTAVNSAANDTSNNNSASSNHSNNDPELNYFFREPVKTQTSKSSGGSSGSLSSLSNQRNNSSTNSLNNNNNETSTPTALPRPTHRPPPPIPPQSPAVLNRPNTLLTPPTTPPQPTIPYLPGYGIVPPPTGNRSPLILPASASYNATNTYPHHQAPTNNPHQSNSSPNFCNNRR